MGSKNRTQEPCISAAINSKPLQMFISTSSMPSLETMQKLLNDAKYKIEPIETRYAKTVDKRKLLNTKSGHKTQMKPSRHDYQRPSTPILIQRTSRKVKQTRKAESSHDSISHSTTKRTITTCNKNKTRSSVDLGTGMNLPVSLSDHMQLVCDKKTKNVWTNESWLKHSSEAKKSCYYEPECRLNEIIDKCDDVNIPALKSVETKGIDIVDILHKNMTDTKNGQKFSEVDQPPPCSDPQSCKQLLDEEIHLHLNDIKKEFAPIIPRRSKIKQNTLDTAIVSLDPITLSANPKPAPNLPYPLEQYPNITQPKLPPYRFPKLPPVVKYPAGKKLIIDDTEAPPLELEVSGNRVGNARRRFGGRKETKYSSKQQQWPNFIEKQSYDYFWRSLNSRDTEMFETHKNNFTASIKGQAALRSEIDNDMFLCNSFTFKRQNNIRNVLREPKKANRSKVTTNVKQREANRYYYSHLLDDEVVKLCENNKLEHRLTRSYSDISLMSYASALSGRCPLATPECPAFRPMSSEGSNGPYPSDEDERHSNSDQFFQDIFINVQ